MGDPSIFQFAKSGLAKINVYEIFIKINLQKTSFTLRKNT